MKKNIDVSLWLGCVESEDDLYDYVSVDYSDDDDDETSKFLADFDIGIDDYDEDMFESDFTDNDTKSLTEMLEGCSYDEDLIPLFVEKYGEKLDSQYNAMILIYEYKYHSRITTSNNENRKFKYVGTVNLDVDY